MTRPLTLRRLTMPVLALFLLSGCAGTPAASNDSAAPAPATQAATTPSPTAELRGERAVVDRVIDGDTIDVRLDGAIERVRLLNIDTPETKDPNEIVECLGPEATEYAEQLLAPGTVVGLEYDQEINDPYGRTLAGIFLEDGRLANAEIARQGLATPLLIEPNDKFLPPVEEAFAEAERKGIGLLDPAIGCTLPTQLEDATEALENASPEDLADAATDAAQAATFLATLDLIDGDVHPHIRHLLEIPSIRQGVAALRTDVTDLEQRAASQQSEDQKRTEKESGRNNDGPDGSAPQAPSAPEPPRAPQAPAAPAAPAVPDAPAVQAPAAPAPPVPPAPPAPAPAPKPAPNVVEQAPPGYVSDLPGYTGPRCYAPGGKVFKPC